MVKNRYNKSKKYSKKYNKSKKSKKYSKKSKKYTKKYSKKSKKYSKKNNKKRFSFKGGNYNTEQIDKMKKLFTAYGYTPDEQTRFLEIFNYSSQYVPANQLIYQLEIHDEDNEVDYNNLTPEEIEKGKNHVTNMVDVTENIFNPKYQGETDSEKDTNSEASSN
jgi:hypothetical protein